MLFTIETITAFLGGSISTIIIKAIIEYFNKKTEHKRQLDKLFYEKKIVAAENIMKSLYQFYQSSLTIITLLDVLLDGEIDEDFFESTYKTYSDKLIESEKEMLNNSAALYFQLDDNEAWSINDQKELIECYTKINFYKNMIEHLRNEIEKIVNENEKEESEKIVNEEYLQPLIEELKIFKQHLVKNNKAVLKTITTIKKDVKRIIN